MNIFKTASLALAAIICFTTTVSCNVIDKADVSNNTDAAYDSSLEQSLTEPTTEPVSSYPDYPISYPEIEQQDTGDIYEAESCELNGTLNVASTRTNFSGEGYVTGFSTDGSSSISFNINAPSNQHYDLSFCIASDELSDCIVYLNESEISRFETTSDGAFTLITLYGVFLVKGESQVRLNSENGNIDLDYLKTSNNTTLSEISYDADSELSNKNAGDSAKELMSFLTENYGKYIITGQYVSDETNQELDLVYRTTGKYPVIRFSALENSGNSFDDSFKEIDAAAEWYNNGGLIGLMWYWESPGKQASVYAKDTDFKLSDAVTDIDLSTLTQEEIRGLYGEGKISEQCYGLILDIDNMAGQLMSLKNKGIPVLWRPLHESSGDWFWWGVSGTDNYKWLWNLMYKRMTDYFELDNLIWIWNGQSADTLVDKSTFDIAAVDIYMGSDKEYSSRYEQFAALQKIIGTDKLIALSECSSVPDIDASFRDNAVWSFFGLWYGEYLSADNQNFSEKYMTKDSFIRAYNSDGAMTLDEYSKLKAEAQAATVTATETEAAQTETETTLP